MDVKKETIEEFLARGGKIVKIDPEIIEEGKKPVKVTTIIPAYEMSLARGEDLFATPSPRKKKKKKAASLSEVNLDLLTPRARMTVEKLKDVEKG